MIAVDTSSLMAILQEEPEARACMARLETEPDLIVSAVTLAEALIVGRRKGVAATMERLLRDLTPEIVSVTPGTAQRVADAYDRWGKGVHPAGLNFADCFAYETAKAHNCPLLYVGEDFALTDVESAI